MESALVPNVRHSVLGICKRVVCWNPGRRPDCYKITMLKWKKMHAYAHRQTIKTFHVQVFPP